MLLEKMYVISGISAKDQKRVYVAIDQASGGYPYWSRRFTDAKQYKKPTDFVDMLDFMIHDVTSWGMLEVEVTGTVVQPGDMVAYARAQTQEKIDALTAELAKEIAVLEQIGK